MNPLLKGITELVTLDGIENKVCRDHCRMTLKHVLKKSPWALKMVDSSSKIPIGLFMGNLVDFGNYDECLQQDVKEDWGSFVGQHCMVDFPLKPLDFLIKNKTLTDAFKYTFSICMPSTCSSEDLSSFLRVLLKQPVTVDPIKCHTNIPKPLQAIEWFTIAIISFFGLLCLLSTVYDLYMKDKRHRREALTSFSWYANGKRLLSTEVSENSMDCLNGMRFLSIMWVLLGHVYYSEVSEPAVNLADGLLSLTDRSHAVVISALFAVDTFLLLSGLLLCYVFLKSMSKEVKFNLLIFYLYRYIRLTPMVAVTALIFAGLITRLSSGPLWDYSLLSAQTNCHENWWTTILYIQNYVTPSNSCVPVTWYLAVDMQLYLLSPLLLFPLLKRPRQGFILLQIVMIISVLSCFSELYGENFDFTDPRVLLTPDHYKYTHTRATPWLVGVALGYILFRNHQWRKDISKGNCLGHSKWVKIFGWLFATACLLLPIIVFHQMVQSNHIPNRMVDAMKVSTGRLLWPLGVAWVIYACLTGCGGAVNTFLSWKIFKPLGRLSFGIYLVHIITITVMRYSTKTPIYISDMFRITSFLLQAILAILVATVASLMFESPVILLTKIMLQKVAENKFGRTKNY